MTKSIAIISEGTGSTARRLLDSILAHYSEEEVADLPIQVYSGIRKPRQLDALLSELHQNCLVIYSLITPGLSDYCRRELARRDVLSIGILEPMREAIERFLGTPTSYEAGRLQSSRGDYYRKMDAIGFSVEHDDGLGNRHLEADLILVGPSRTVKTPTAMFISTHYGLKVANLSIVAAPSAVEGLLEKLVGVPSEKIFGMIMKPELLAEVRERRLDMFVPDSTHKRELRSYQDITAVKKEITFCKRLYAKEDWEPVAVGGKSVEEIAKRIVKELSRRRS